MKSAIQFLKSQKLLVIASRDSSDVWIANVYYGVDDAGTLYFISPESTRHSRMILEHPTIAFSVAWFDSENHSNRKAIQGTGICRPAENDDEVKTGVMLHNNNFPEFKERITEDWIRTNEYGSKVWVLKPSYMKYWDDEAYGDDESEEFELN